MIDILFGPLLSLVSEPDIVGADPPGGAATVLFDKQMSGPIHRYQCTVRPATAFVRLINTKQQAPVEEEIREKKNRETNVEIKVYANQQENY